MIDLLRNLDILGGTIRQRWQIHDPETGDDWGNHDVVFTDNGEPPIAVLEPYGQGLIRPRGVHATIEVKSILGGNPTASAKKSQGTLGDALESVARAQAPYRTPAIASGIVAYGRRLALKTIVSRVESWCASRPVRQWPHFITILGQDGCHLQWWSPVTTRPLLRPEKGAKLTRVLFAQNDTPRFDGCPTAPMALIAQLRELAKSWPPVSQPSDTAKRPVWFPLQYDIGSTPWETL